VRGRLLAACLWAGLLLSVAAPSALAQDSKEQEAPAPDQMKWKLINTALFAIGLGYMIAKSAPAFFNARSADIQKTIKDATGLKIEADFRYSEIDRKMATLADEVGRMRAEGSAEMEREHQRMRSDTELEMDRVGNNVAAELEAFRKEGIRKVRRQTVQAALALAERRLREKLSGGEPEELVRDFVKLVERGKN
jgi:F-type H+-transporting ATPase subunit b